MTCNLSELRRQLDTMQTLLDTYEHYHAHDSVTPEEKVIIERTKAKCIEAVKAETKNMIAPYTTIESARDAEICMSVSIKAIQGV